MSYDVSIGDFNANYTSNNCNLFYDHIHAQERVDAEGKEMEDRGGIPGLNGMTGRKAGARILAAMESMNQERSSLGSDSEVGEPKMCEKYDNKNGWGSLVGQLLFLGRIAAACATFPDEIVYASA